MKYLILVVLLFLSTPLFATNSIVGTWKYFDEETGKEASLVRIEQADGVFTGTIIEFLNQEDDINMKCEKCKDDRKDQPILGLEIIRNVVKKQSNKWSGGTILATTTGKEFKVKLSLAEQGESLKVRGYVGTPIMGKTQIWKRVEH